MSSGDAVFPGVWLASWTRHARLQCDHSAHVGH